MCKYQSKKRKRGKDILTQNRCGPVYGPGGGGGGDGVRGDVDGVGLRSGHGAPYRPGRVLEQ